MILNVSH